MLHQKILKTRCLRLAKNAFAIQHLLHHSIIYTFINYPANFVLLRWTCISEVIPAVHDQVAFFLLVRVFPLNLSFYLNFYNYIFLSWGNIFWELKTFSGPVVRYFFHPCTSRPSPLAMSESLTKYSIKGHHERRGRPCLNIFKFYNNARDIYNYIQTLINNS